MGEAVPKTLFYNFKCPSCGTVRSVTIDEIEKFEAKYNGKVYSLMAIRCKNINCDLDFTVQVDDEKTIRLLGRSVAFLQASKNEGGGRERRRKAAREFNKIQKELKEAREALNKKLDGKTVFKMVKHFDRVPDEDGYGYDFKVRIYNGQLYDSV